MFEIKLQSVWRHTKNLKQTYTKKYLSSKWCFVSHWCLSSTTIRNEMKWNKKENGKCFTKVCTLCSQNKTKTFKQLRRGWLTLNSVTKYLSSTLSPFPSLYQRVCRASPDALDCLYTCFVLKREAKCNIEKGKYQVQWSKFN